MSTVMMDYLCATSPRGIILQEALVTSPWQCKQYSHFFLADFRCILHARCLLHDPCQNDNSLPNQVFRLLHLILPFVSLYYRTFVAHVHELALSKVTRSTTMFKHGKTTTHSHCHVYVRLCNFILVKSCWLIRTELCTSATPFTPLHYPAGAARGPANSVGRQSERKV